MAGFSAEPVPRWEPNQAQRDERSVSPSAVRHHGHAGKYADKQELEEAIIRRHYASSIEDEENQVDQGAAAAGGLSQGMRPEANRRKPALRP